MTPRATRTIRAGLLVTVAALGGLVTWTLRHRPPRAASDRPGADASPVEGTHVQGFQRVTFEKDKVRFEIAARTLSGSEDKELYLTGVEVKFGYMAHGQPGTTVVKADECAFTPAINKAVFRGNVQVTTAEGFTLQAQSLTYRGDKNLARSGEPVAFQRKDVSGTSSGVEYHAAEGRLELPADVVVKLADPDDPPMEIKAGKATIEKFEGLLKFAGGVDVVQGGDRLRAARFVMNLTEDHQSIYRAQAIDDVDVQMTGDVATTGLTTPQARGPRRLLARKLDLWFRPDRTLQEATAGPDAALTIQPRAGDPVPEQRVLKARFLVFVFDEAGRLAEMRAQKDAYFRADPVPPAKTTARTLTCQSFVAKVDPATGEPEVIDFTKDVLFVQGPQKGRAQKAYYDGPKTALFLMDDAVATDEAQDTELKAGVIMIGTRSGDLNAHDAVRHVFHRKDGGGLLSAKDEPSVMTAGIFEYTEATRTAVYRAKALLRSGKDEVQAEEIRIVELPGGKRRLEAEKGVVSRMQPAASAGKARPAPVEGRAGQMAYDEAKAEIRYTGDVTIRQGDIETRSPQATLSLGADGGTLKSLVAGQPVEVKQGVRTASGATATYTPGDETMVLVGEKVVLRDPTQEIEGRSLTFRVGADRILVDGRQEIRTQMIIRQEGRN
ncbi:MAG TPA: LptA/OstA family protein [Vicinamibacteria bacterium]|nr:LptA/OstA family protein [Vicinamibacteria bacterium]